MLVWSCAGKYFALKKDAGAATERRLTEAPARRILILSSSHGSRKGTTGSAR